MKTFIVILSAIVFFAMAAAHAWRVHAGMAVVVAGHAVPMSCSIAAAAISAILGLGLLLAARK